eukprot:jgi/Mesen1/6783/ME000348S06049
MASPTQQDTTAAYRVELNQEEAKDMVQRGASLLFLDVPPGTSLGIDQQMFVVGPKFKGVKMLPAGTHFVYTSATGRHGNEAAPVVVRQWDARQESLAALHDPDQEERYAAAVRRFEFDSQLGAFDIHSYATWQRLSNHITPEPVGGEISVMAEADLADMHPKTAGELRLVEQLQRGRASQAAPPEPSSSAQPGDMPPLSEAGGEAAPSGPGETGGEDLPGGARPSSETLPGDKGEVTSGSGRCFYTRLPRLVKEKGMTARQLTELNLDKSEALERVLEGEYGGAQELLLGEMQFSFIAFLPLHQRTKLFTKEWFSVLREAPQIDSQLHVQAKRLRELLETTLGWQLIHEPLMADYEDDEYAPIIVSEEDATPMQES